MNSFRVGILLGLRQIQRASIWTTILIIFVMMLTFLNLIAVSGVLLGLIAGAERAVQENALGDIIISALDDEDRRGVLERIAAEGKKGRINETRFKGLGEMNPLQLRESTIDPDTRRVVQLTVDNPRAMEKVMDMLLGKKRAGDRKSWLEAKGNLAEVEL